MNMYVCIGRLVREPEVREVNDTTVANFSVAVNEGYKDKDTGEWKETAVFPDFQLWGSRAEFVGKLKKGALLQVVGKYNVRSWEDKEGNKRYTHSFRVDQLECLDYGPNAEKPVNGNDKKSKEESNKEVVEKSKTRRGRPAKPKVEQPPVEDDNDNTPF